MSRRLNEDIKLLKAGQTTNTFIYVLVVPRDGDIRYVGKSHTDKTKEKVSKQRGGVGYSMYSKIRKESSKTYRPVIQLDLDGGMIDKWDGVTISSKRLKINRCTISDVCNGRKKTDGGFKWKYNG